MQLPDFLNRLPDGEIVLTGHRIGLYHVVRGYNEGESAEMLASRYPTLPLALVHKVIAYYLDHRADVDEYIASCTAAMKSQQDDSRPLSLNALRLRLSVGSPSLPNAEHSL